jgi:hypothetical protein
MSLEEFAKLADAAAKTVTSPLELDTFSRMGFRTWNLFPLGREECDASIQNLQLFPVNRELQAQLGVVSDLSYRIVIERPSHMVRLAISPFEQSVRLPPGLITAANTKPERESHRQRQKRLDSLKAKKVVSSFPPFGLLLDLDAFIEDPPFPDQLSVVDFITRAGDDFEAIKSLALVKAEESR